MSSPAEKLERKVQDLIEICQMIQGLSDEEAQADEADYGKTVFKKTIKDAIKIYGKDHAKIENL